MLTYFRINYLTNLTYFPIFSHYVDFSKVAAASPLAAAATAAVDRTTVNSLNFFNSKSLRHIFDNKNDDLIKTFKL